MKSAAELECGVMKVMRDVEATVTLPLGISAMLDCEGEHRLGTKALYEEHWMWSIV